MIVILDDPLPDALFVKDVRARKQLSLADLFIAHRTGKIMIVVQVLLFDCL